MKINSLNREGLAESNWNVCFGPRVLETREHPNLFLFYNLNYKTFWQKRATTNEDLLLVIARFHMKKVPPSPRLADGLDLANLESSVDKHWLFQSVART